MTPDPFPGVPVPPSHAEPSPVELSDLLAGGALARALFEQSPFSAIVYDPAGRPLLVNPAFERFWGLTLETIPAGYTVLEDPELDRGGMLPLVRRAFAGESVVLPEVRYDIARLVGEGRTTWTQGHFYPVRDGSGAITQVVLVHVDLTARKEAEAEVDRLYREALASRDQLEEQTAEMEIQAMQLQEQAAELEEQRDVARRAADAAEAANRAKTDFLAVMSHELRTPLNAIGGYAQLMEMGVHGPVTPGQREGLERIQRNQRHLLSLINDILNFARVEAGQVQYRTERVPVDETLAGLEPLVAPQLAARELRYEYGGTDPGVAVSADGEKVGQILLNLLSNAIKFTAVGGRMRVEVETGEEAVRIRVEDTGIGIPADKLEAVFEPFVQLSRDLRSSQEGTGLGLAISRDLARAMSGDLGVVSAPGEGSTFTLHLPTA